ncbi:MAG: hypothetical protein WA843_03610 [Candidatus Saccharimonadales bacterium]
MRKRIHHPPRNLLRQTYIGSGEFIPSLAVRRPVIMEDREATDIQKRLRRGLKREVPRSHARGYEMLKPQDWSVTLIEKGRLKNQLRQNDVLPTSRDMMRLAGAMRVLLLDLLAEMSTQVPLSLGETDRFGEGKPKWSLGVVPVGRRGLRAHYPEQDETGNANTLGLLVAENKICVEALTNTRLLSENQAVSTLSKTPHLKVMRNKNGIRDHEFDIVGDVVRSALPDEVMLGDPVTYLYVQQGFRKPLEASLRPVDLGAAA